MEQVNWAPKKEEEKDFGVLEKKLREFFRAETPGLLVEACRSTK